MTVDEYAAFVKWLGVAMPKLLPAYWPLLLPAVQLLEDVERTRYHCPLCHQWIRKPDLSAHTCACPVSTTRKALRTRGFRWAGGASCR